ncbi:inositol hexakisphosphate-domain-containing protein [Lanmaoa asiatica]|nr:inositol hexakisphosphate-domain-containing protein [Lanmaoa asiatica]
MPARSLLQDPQGTLERGSSLARPMSVPVAHPDKSAAPSSPLVDNADTARISAEGSLAPPNKDGVRPLDLMVSLKRAEPLVVKTRTGSVLSRGFILKTDYYPSGRALDLDLNVHGAPNFRAPRQGNLNVFGVAQPRTQGLRAILSALRCRPGTRDPSHVVWFSTREEPIVYISGRPFVLRDSTEPRKTLSLSDRAENLEAIEDRLKHDILQEASKYGGLILTHNELAAESCEHGAILPTWTHVDNVNVRTSRELWQNMRLDGWNVEVGLSILLLRHNSQFPVSPACLTNDDNYLDAYLRVIKDADPVRSALVFSCGMGAVRTTFAMVAALIIRRKILIVRGLDDPYATKSSFVLPSGTLKQGSVTPGISTQATDMKLALALENASAQQDSNKSLLRLTYVLQQHLHSQSAIALLMSQPVLLENLRKAHQGNYGVILSLLGCLDHGLQAKKLVDRVIDTCDHVTNLREDILVHRVRYSLTTPDDDGAKREDILVKAGRSLEKYFFMIAFASYVDSVPDFTQTFSDWLKVMFLRKSRGSRLNVFAPVNDLSLLSRSGAEDKSLVAGQKNDVEIAGGQLLGDEYSDHVVKNRSGIILRERLLLHTETPDGSVIPIWEEVQSEDVAVLKDIMASRQSGCGIEVQYTRIPITAERPPDMSDISELMELVVRTDSMSTAIVVNCQLGRGRSTLTSVLILLIQQWLKDSRPLAQASPRLLSGSRSLSTSVPRTEEQPVNWRQSYQVMDNFLRIVRQGPVVKNAVDEVIDRCAEVLNLRDSIEEERVKAVQATDEKQKRVHTSKGLCKDQSIVWTDGLSGLHNLRRYFELVVFQAYLQSTEADTLQSIESFEKFIENRPGNYRSSFITGCAYELRTVIKTFEKDLIAGSLNALIPLERIDSIAHPDEVKQVVVNRSGSILSASTILKSDFFSNLQKMTLPERIDGSPNFRRMPLTLILGSSGNSISKAPIALLECVNDEKMVCGRYDFTSPTLGFQYPRLPNEHSGMPTVQGCVSINTQANPRSYSHRLRRALARVDAGPQGTNMVFWTSLREEPVVYVAGRPHVLRLVDKPLENVEATGVTTAMVETMEERFKQDVLRELRQGGGRILLHDEVEERPGVFAIIPIWETVSEEDIMTPRDVFDLVTKEGYKTTDTEIQTDEQAPLPDALSQLLNRVRLGYSQAGDFIFNCQMGRGRTTTGMVTACLISTVMNWVGEESVDVAEDMSMLNYDSIDGPSEEEAYLQGEYKTILQLVGVLSHGKIAKRLTDRAIDLMQDVQNLRKAIYDYKLKAEACEKGSAKQEKLMNVAVNYLYRYGALIVFCNYLIEMRGSSSKGEEKPFPASAILPLVFASRHEPIEEREAIQILSLQPLQSKPTRLRSQPRHQQAAASSAAAPSAATSSSAAGATTTHASSTESSSTPAVLSSVVPTTATDSLGQPFTSYIVTAISTPSATPTQTGTSNNSGGGGLSTGSIIGLSVAGGIAAVGIILFFVWKFTRKRFTDFDDSTSVYVSVSCRLMNIDIPPTDEAIKWPELNAHSDDVHALPTHATGRAGFGPENDSDINLTRAPSPGGAYANSIAASSVPETYGTGDPYAVPPLPHLNPNQPYHDEPSAYGQSAGYYDPYRGPVPNTFADTIPDAHGAESIPMTQMARVRSPGPQVAYDMQGRGSPAPQAAMGYAGMDERSRTPIPGTLGTSSAPPSAHPGYGYGP